jgi:hypothetical protein
MISVLICETEMYFSGNLKFLQDLKKIDFKC